MRQILIAVLFAALMPPFVFADESSPPPKQILWIIRLNRDFAQVKKLVDAGVMRAYLETEPGGLGSLVAVAAGQNKHPEVLEMLLDEGWNTTDVIADGNTAFHFAAMHNPNPQILRTLTARTPPEARLAAFAARNQAGYTPLEAAILYNFDPAIIRCQMRLEGIPAWYIREDLAAINQPPTHNPTLRKQSSAERFWLAVRAGCPLSVVEQIFDMQYLRVFDYLPTKDEHADVLRHTLTARHPQAYFQYLLRAGADFTGRDQHGDTLLHAAVSLPAPPMEAIPFLAERFSSVNLPNRDGDTPLHLVLFAENDADAQALRCLLRYGANPLLKNKAGLTPMDLAVTDAQREILRTVKPDSELTVRRKARRRELTAVRPTTNNTPAFDRLLAAIHDGCDGAAFKALAAKETITVNEAKLLLQAAAESATDPQIILTLMPRAAVQANTPAFQSLTNTALATNPNVDFVLALLAMRDERGDQQTLLNQHLRQAMGRKGNIPVIKYLVDAGADITPHTEPAAFLQLIRDGAGRELVEYLVSQWADLQAMTPQGETAMHLAAQSLTGCDAALLRYLSENGLDPHARADDGRGLLEMLIANPGSEDALRFLQEKGFDLQKTDAEGRTLLHLAVTKPENSAMVDALLYLGMDINAHDQLGRTPLHMACNPLQATHSNYLDQNIFCLLARMPDVNIQDAAGNTPLHLLFSSLVKTDPHNFRDGTRAILSELARCGADPTIKNHDGVPALNRKLPPYLSKIWTHGIFPRHAPQMSPDVSEARKRELERMLAAMPYQPQAPQESATNENHVALLCEALELNVAHHLVKRIITPEVVRTYNNGLRETDRRTLIHRAAAHCTDPRTLRLLAEHGAMAYLLDHRNRTPLHLAAEENPSPEALRCLYELSGGDALQETDSLPDADGLTPLECCALRGKYAETMEALMGLRGVFTEDDRYQWGVLACGRNPNPAVLRALGFYAHLNQWYARQPHRDTRAVLAAAALPYTPACSADIFDDQCDFRLRDASGSTLLHLAAAGATDPDRISLFLDHKIDVNARNHHGRTPLHLAAEENADPNHAALKTLIAAGADLHATDADGKTPLDLASTPEKREIILAAMTRKYLNAVIQWMHPQEQQPGAER